MNDSVPRPEDWIRHDSPGPARERLRNSVEALTRARHLQRLLDGASAGLLAGCSIAILAVVLVRLLSLPFPLWQVVLISVLPALAAGLLLAWWRRPDALEVAIRADLALRLKQRLSTAWEMAAGGGDPNLADRLAVQAVKAGLPARPATIFPIRLNHYARLVPVAAAALLLVSVVDIDRLGPGPTANRADPQVGREGERLAQFARAMQDRAERDELPRSRRQAAQIERLGSRMEGGALSQSEALQRLRELRGALEQERSQALAEAGGSGSGNRRAPAGSGSSAAGLDARGMLDRMQRGGLGDEDRRRLRAGMNDLERAGIGREQLESALDRNRQGADSPLQEILEKLAQVERALREDKELRDAREQVLRAQDSLGEPNVASESHQGPTAQMDWGEDEAEDRGNLQAGKSVGSDQRRQSERARQSARGGSHADSSIATERMPAAPQNETRSSGPVLAAKGQLRPGDSFTSQGRVLPRSAAPRVQNAPVRPDYAVQLEQVLSNEQVPAHDKEFVRRYFLTLSEGERALPAEPQPDTGGRR